MTLDFNTTWKSVEGTARKMCSRYHVASFTFEDLMQEAMMELWDTMQLFDESYGVKINTLYHSRLRNRMAKVLHQVNRQMNYYNVPQYSQMDDDGIEMLISSKYPNPEQNVLRTENLKDTTEFVDSLHPEYKKIIKYLLKGEDRRDIAKKMGYKYSTMSKRIQDLRALMNQNPTPEDIKAFNKHHRRKLKINGLNKRK